MAIDTHDDEAAARALLAAAEADTSPVAIRARIDLLGLKISLASCLLLAPIYIGLIVWWLDQIRHAEKETTLIQLLVPILFGGGTLLAIALFTRALTQPDKTTPEVISFAIRRAAERGVDSQTPVTTIADAPASMYGERSEIPAVICQWPERPSWRESSAAKLVSIVLFQLFLLVGFIQSLNIGVIPWSLFILIPLVSIAAGWFRDRSEISYIVADDMGLHGREYPRSPNKTLLPWNQIISFTARECQPSEESRTTIYSVTANDAVITWRGKHSSARNEWAQVDPTAGVHLAQYVAAHATVPLRDVTLAWDDICATVRWIEREAAGEAVEPANIAVQASVPGLGRVIRDVIYQRRQPWRRIARSASWIPLAIFLALYVADMFIRSRG
jgi:hypothetical protein